MNKIVLIFLSISIFSARAQVLPGFKVSGNRGEQQMVIENHATGTRTLINAPLNGFTKHSKALLVFYALPNGNTIEQTIGKTLKPGDDWHYNIQHIGAQTRFLRNAIRNRTVVVVYVENNLHSWPAWKARNPGYKTIVKEMVGEVESIFRRWRPEIAMNGHSGGGRFIFSYLDAFNDIPRKVTRIAFLDSDYGYEDSLYFSKLVRWLTFSERNKLCVLAYNDSVVVYNGKPLVSPTGGTWYRSRLMLRNLSRQYRFICSTRDSLEWYSTRNRQIEIILKPNPEKKIYHTVQVEKNGFIHSMLSGTPSEEKGYHYFGPNAYATLISDTVIIPVRRMNIPERQSGAETGSAFMKRIGMLSREGRETEIADAILCGNIPDFLRNTITLSYNSTDAAGKAHNIVAEVMPDYLSIGNRSDNCRIPMNPHTAQRIADSLGASLITAKLSNLINSFSEICPEPFFYKPVGNANELPEKFIAHNQKIESQLALQKWQPGKLVSGIKKDVILSAEIAGKPDKVVIYGWHKPDGTPIQPVYSGHVYWYVDYSHGIRLINNQVLIDGKPALFSEVLKDPILFRLFSNEGQPMQKSRY